MSSIDHHAELTDEEFELILQKDSQLFEDDLKSSLENHQQLYGSASASVLDPLERAKLRHMHYQKQSNQRLDRMRALGTLAKKKEKDIVNATTLSRIKEKVAVDLIHGREFEAHGAGKLYRGPLMTSGESSDLIIEQQKAMISFLSNSNNNNQRAEEQFPVFLGEDGTLYDKHYMPVLRQDAAHLQNRGKFSHVTEEGLHLAQSAISSYEQKMTGSTETTSNNNNDTSAAFVEQDATTLAQIEPTQEDYLREYEYCHDPDLYQTIPNPYSFSSFEEYETALQKWGEDVRNRIGYLQLPIVMGRHYFRPNVSHTNDDLVAAAMRKKKNSLEDGTSATFNILDGEDTWESNLIPLEPKPEFYETFEEYERAMIRWSIIVMGLDHLPPHSAQFQKLMGLRIVDPPTHPIADVEVDSLDKKNNDEEEEELEDKNQYTTSSKTQTRQKKRRRRPSDIDHVYRDNNEHLSYKGSDEWTKLKEQDQELIRKAFNKVWETQCQNRAKYGVFHTQVVPFIHGVFEDENRHKLLRRLSLSKMIKIGVEQKKKIETTNDWITQLRRERSISSVVAKSSDPYNWAIIDDLKHQIALRRLDLSEEQLNEAHDCNLTEQGREVTFKIPPFDIGIIEFNLLKENSYIGFLQILLKRMDFSQRYAVLNSWYYPKIPKEVHEKNVTELVRMFDEVQHPTQVTPKMFLDIFKTDAYLDIFADFFDRKPTYKILYKGNQEIKKFSELLQVATTIDTFKSALEMLSSSRSALLRAKVSFFITSLLKNEKGVPIMETFIGNCDVQGLYDVACAVTFYDEVPVQLFRFTMEMQALVKIRFGASVSNFINDIVLIYLLSSLCVSMTEENVYRVYPLFLSSIQQKVETCVKYLEQNPEFFQMHMWSMIGSRSVQISSLGTFVLRFLFSLGHESTINKLFKSTDIIVIHLRRLATSKIGHVQTAVGKLFQYLEDERWQSLFTKVYSMANNVVDDLVKSAHHSPLDSQPPLISSCVFKGLSDALTIKDYDNEDGKNPENHESYQMILGLIKDEGFHAVLSEVIATSRERRMHQGTIMGAMFLAKFAKFVVCNSMITGKDANKKSSSGGKQILSMFGRNKKKDNSAEANSNEYTGPKLEITIADISQMMDFVCSENTKNRRAYRPRMFMLEALRHLMKCPSVFEMVTVDKSFLTRIYEICEDGMDMDFNRNAWRFLYQIIKFHPNTIETIIKCNCMANFLELIGMKIGRSSTVTTNSIHYFNKIFNLPENTLVDHTAEAEDMDNEKRVSVTKRGFNVPSSSVVEKYANSVKALSDQIIQRQLYNNFHLVYTKLIINYQGWPFQSMVELYRTLNTHSSCAKIAQIFKKQPEYKNGLDKVADMIRGHSEH